MQDERAVLGLSSAVLFEFQVRLQDKGVLDRHPDTVAEYEALFDVPIPVDGAVASAAFQLKRDTPQRLPTVDALIASCAKVHDAVLVHRDPQVARITGHLLKQEVLPAKT